MEQSSYSVIFTGTFLHPLPHELQWAELRKVFPHAAEAELLEFFKRKRLLLTHTDSELTARELVSALGDHGLECEYSRIPMLPTEVHGKAESALSQPHLILASHLVPGNPVPTPPAPATPNPQQTLPPRPPPTVADEDALTPRGRRWATITAIGVGALSVYSVWTAIRSTYGHAENADNGEMIPTLCALHESTSWFSGHGTYSLACSASNNQGRYKLLMSCTQPEDFKAKLAFYDLAGKPRSPVWSDAWTGLSIIYRLADGSRHELKLRETDQPHIGNIDGLTAGAAGILLANPSAAFSGVFGSESVTFQLEPARWYINALIFSCQLSKPSADAGRLTFSMMYPSHPGHGAGAIPNDLNTSPES